MTEWISVKDQQPPVDKEILTYMPKAKYHSKINAALYDGEDFWFDTYSSEAYGITHWAILTEPQKDEGL